jgi:hypothetical protein
MLYIPKPLLPLFGVEKLSRAPKLFSVIFYNNNTNANYITKVLQLRNDFNLNFVNYDTKNIKHLTKHYMSKEDSTKHEKTVSKEIKR